VSHSIDRWNESNETSENRFSWRKDSDKMNAKGGCDMERKACQIARKTKDKNYDGKFYFGVKTTGIFCRPSCPAPLAKEENVVYFDTVFVVAQSDLSTKIYVETFKRILGDEKNVLALPLRMDASPQFSYNVAGLLVRGGEILGKRKLAFKEESL